MNELAERLMVLGFEPMKDFVLVNRGGSTQVESWLSSLPQPSPAELAAVTPVQRRAKARAERQATDLRFGRKDRVLIDWIAGRTGGGTPAEVQAELLAAWEARYGTE